MAATQGRRKHGACFLRIRENCPFRKLRKNKCYDIENVPTKKLGNAGLTSVTTQPSQPSISPLVTLTNHKNKGLFQIACKLLPNNGLSTTMDTDNLRSPASPIQAGPSNAAPALPSPAPSPLVPISAPQHQHNLAAFSCDTSMELDSGVDPETGERAQG